MITDNSKQLRDVGNLIKGLKVAAYVAKVIVAGLVIVEFTEKYSDKFGKEKVAMDEVKVIDTVTES